jgi:hypothetical protein
MILPVPSMIRRNRPALRDRDFFEISASAKRCLKLRVRTIEPESVSILLNSHPLHQKIRTIDVQFY